MMPRMTPDVLNGKKILRPVAAHSDGIPKLASSSVFHPPSIHVDYPLVSADEIVAEAVLAITQGGMCTTSKLQRELRRFLNRMAINERKRCTQELKANGFDIAAGAITRPNYIPE